MMLNERQTGLGGSTQRLHHEDTNMWIYKCNVGEYTEIRLNLDNFMQDLVTYVKGV